jgi:hypothetical protein
METWSSFAPYLRASRPWAACSASAPIHQPGPHALTNSLFGWLVVDGWCCFVLREEYCWLVAAVWFLVREKYCCLVADKPSEQGEAATQAHPSDACCWGYPKNSDNYPNTSMSSQHVQVQN